MNTQNVGKVNQIGWQSFTQRKNVDLNVGIRVHSSSQNKKGDLFSNKYLGGYQPKGRNVSTTSLTNVNQLQGNNQRAFRPRPQALYKKNFRIMIALISEIKEDQDV